MYAVDFHAHTRFFHGHRNVGDQFDPIGARLLAAAASARGLDGVATTNHDYYTPVSSAAVSLLPGIEVSTTHGHILVVGPDPPAETVPFEYTPNEVVEMAHDRGCAAIIAHPYRNSEGASDQFADVPFDAIEINGKHPRTQPLVERIADNGDLPIVAGSDAHFPLEVGRAYTLIDADDCTPGAIVNAIREERVEPRVATGPLDAFLRRCYRVIHRRKHPETTLSCTNSELTRLAAHANAWHPPVDGTVLESLTDDEAHLRDTE